MYLYYARGLLELARGRYQEALADFQSAERLASALVTSHTLDMRMRAYLLRALVRLGQTERVEAALAGLDSRERQSTEMRTALASLRLAQHNPQAAMVTLAPVIDGSAETRVLRYLPTNLTVPEIADQLSVSVTTVRTHIGHRYDKLGAHRRSEAVEQARAVGLLASSARRP